MQSYDGERRLALLARGFAALWLMLELIFSAQLADAAPFAYVANHSAKGSPLPPMGNTSMLRMGAPIPFR